MGLKTLKARLPKKERRPDLTVDLGAFADGETLSFREPGVSELVGDGRGVTRVRTDFPRLSPTVAQMCCMLAACYLPVEGEGRADPLDFAAMAVERPDVWTVVATAFGEAFPLDMDAKVDDLKND